jgi:3-deoxy-D-manno-octulosonic-acid transferase
LVLVNELGRLADLYGQGVMAYVGGGFRRGGLHSVLESAAWGVPTVTGPEVQGFAEALLLRDRGGLMTLPRRGAATILEAWWETWLTNVEAREDAGRTARSTVRECSGAADRCALLVEDLMAGSGRA